MPRIFGLDVARAVAIWLVLAAHLCVWALEEWPLSAALRTMLESAAFLGGFLGVELFFVLSGFLVGGIALKAFERNMDARGLRDFYLRRWLRTLPAYYFVLVVLAGFKDVPFSWQHVFFLQAFEPQKPDFFSVSWSLCIEEWFYLLLPVFCFLLMKAPKQKRIWVVAAAVLAVCITRAWVWHEFTPAFETLRRFVPTRMDALFIGVGLAVVQRYHVEIWKKLQRAGWVSLPLLLVAAGIYHQRHAHPETLTLLKTYFLMPWWFTLCSLNFALLLSWLSGWKKARGAAAFVVTGSSLLAYSLYLVHNEIFLMLRADKGLAASPLGMGLGLVLAFLAAFVLFKGVEKPFMKWRDRITTHGKARA